MKLTSKIHRKLTEIGIVWKRREKTTLQEAVNRVVTSNGDTESTRHIGIGSLAIWPHHYLSLPLCPSNNWPGPLGCNNANRLVPNRQREIPITNQILRQDLLDQLCHGLGNRNRPGVPIWNELV